MKYNAIINYLGLTREVLLISNAKITSHVRKTTVNLLKSQSKLMFASNYVAN